MLSTNIPRGHTSMNLPAHDSSLDLFNINEHDHEYDHNDLQRSEDLYDESFSLDLQSHTANIFGYTSSHSNNDARLSSNNSDPFFDNASSGYGGQNQVLNTISEGAEHQFHANQGLARPMNLMNSYPAYYSSSSADSGVFGHYQPIQKPNFVPQLPHQHQGHVPQHVVPPTSLNGRSLNTFGQTMQPYQQHPFVAPCLAPVTPPPPGVAILAAAGAHLSTIQHHAPPPHPFSSVTDSTTIADGSGAGPTDCSVCMASYPLSLAILRPCGHPLCSGCLTSALNIVGEKDMRCAVCAKGVEDFRLISIKKPSPAGIGGQMGMDVANNRGKGTSVGVIGSGSAAFGGDLTRGTSARREMELDGESMDFGFNVDDLRASTPKIELQQRTGSASAKTGDSSQNVVLRIDNVPWVRIPPIHRARQRVLICVSSAQFLGHHSAPDNDVVATACGARACLAGQQGEDVEPCLRGGEGRWNCGCYTER